jgi:Cdc6-like AAA superfamily ATPase
MANETYSIVPWLIKTLNVETGSKMLVTFIAIFGALWATFPAVSRFVRVKRAVYVLSRETLCSGLPAHLLPRPGLLNSLKSALEDPNLNTVLVYGVRGSGKTTAMNKALEKRLAVVAWTMAAE